MKVAIVLLCCALNVVASDTSYAVSGIVGRSAPRLLQVGMVYDQLEELRLHVERVEAKIDRIETMLEAQQAELHTFVRVVIDAIGKRNNNNEPSEVEDQLEQITLLQPASSVQKVDEEDLPCNNVSVCTLPISHRGKVSQDALKGIRKRYGSFAKLY